MSEVLATLLALPVGRGVSGICNDQKKGLEYQGFLIPLVVWAQSFQLGLEKPELSISAAACSV